MTVVLAVVLVILVAAFIVSPFLAERQESVETGPPRDELWKHEKAVAVLAITEADFDLATGKLSDDDYQILRSDYEGRALHAMDEIEKLAPAATAGEPAKFCAGCGACFAGNDAFCGSCGCPRFGREQ